MIYTFHLLKTDKIEVICIFGRVNLSIWMSLFDIPAIYPLSLKVETSYLDLGMTSA